MSTVNQLTQRILAFIEEPDPDAFNSLAVAIHQYQLQRCPTRKALTVATSAPIRGYTSIPAIPVDLFKSLNIGTVPQGEGVEFHTSGTTAEVSGVHRLLNTTLYDQGAKAGVNRLIGPLPNTSLALLQSPSIAPHSSLSHMVNHLFGDQSVQWFVTANGLDIRALNLALSKQQQPVFIATTAFALAQWLSHKASCPPGSMLMVTGGFKGRKTSFDANTLLQRAKEQLPAVQIIQEYGMTELSSQMWAKEDGTYHAPPWLRVYAVNPKTGQPLPPDHPGQLRFVDLCNLHSSVAIETMDHGTVDRTGALTLHGRLTDSPARGCSLTIEDLT